jgi:hypothetical protein
VVVVETRNTQQLQFDHFEQPPLSRRSRTRKETVGLATVARRRLLVFGLVAALAAAGGTAWAVTQADSPDLPAPTAGIVAQGTAPSGASYTISQIDAQDLGEDPSKAFCFEIVTPAASSQGCAPVPDGSGLIDGQPQRPSFALLGADRFFAAVAPRVGVKAMQVRIDGEAKAAASRSLDAGSAGTLLLVTVGGRTVDSRDPSSSRDYEVRLLDANGGTVRKVAMSDPRE